MPESDVPRTPGSGDVPESWGFHLLQELRRLEDKMDARFEAMDTKIERLDAKFDAKLDRLDIKFTQQVADVRQEIADVRQEIRGLRYWSWGAILTVVAAAVATILTVLLH